MEPKEKGGMVTIMQKKGQDNGAQRCSHCIEVDVGHGNEFTIRNLEMNLTFDEKENNAPEYDDGGEDMEREFQTKGSEKAMKEFFLD